MVRFMVFAKGLSRQASRGKSEKFSARKKACPTKPPRLTTPLKAGGPKSKNGRALH
jgi:hypothetical protein